MTFRSLLTKTLPFYLVLGIASEDAHAKRSELPDVVRMDKPAIELPNAVSANGLDADRVRPISPYQHISAAETEHRYRNGWISDPHHTEMNPHSSNTPHQPVGPVTRSTVCNVDLLATAVGRDLVDHILGLPNANCLTTLLASELSPFMASVFRMANMLTVAEEAKARSAYYPTEGAENLIKFFAFLRIGHQNNFYARPVRGMAARFDWHDATVALASMDAVDVFFRTEDFLLLDSSEHGAVVMEAFHLTHYLDISRYIQAYIGWLRVLSPERVASDEMGRATNRVLEALFKGHYEYYIGAEWRSNFIRALGSDDEWVGVLLAVALSTEIYDVHTSLPENAARELSRFLQYESPDNCDQCPLAVIPSVKSAVRTIFEEYDVFEKGDTVMLIAAKVIYDLQLCEVVDICGLRDDVEASILPIRHQCPYVSVTIRAQGLVEEGRAFNCELLAATNHRFHSLLRTREDDPVQGDLNENLHVIIYSNSNNYWRYSRFLFGNSTNNGGIFREGDPADADPPLIIVYEADWATDPDRGFYPVNALEHEYAHYLDGRFVKRGASWDYGSYIVGWAEGLAEYVAYFNDHSWALELAATVERPPSFGRILRATYVDSGDLVYRWGYLAVRFLFEQRPVEVDKIVELLRAGMHEEYDEYIVELAALDDEFSRWLEVVVHVSLDEIVLGEPVSTEEGRAKVNLLPHFFMGLDGEGIVFTAEVESGDGVASIMLSDASLIILPEAPGVVTVRVSARYRGFVWHQTFEAVVTDECPDYLCRSRPSWWWAVFADASEAEASQEDSVEESLPH